MPNSEYLRLKALLDSNPKYKIFLNAVSKAEGTWGKDSYSTTYGGGKSDWRNGKDQTVRNDSSAHGKYQFMNKTWKKLIDELDLKGFSPEEQDIAALKLAEEKNALKHIDDGEMEKAFYSVSKIWAAIPKDASGQSALNFKNGKSQPAKSIKTIMGYATSNEAARAAVNDGYKIKSESTAKEYLKAYKQIKLVGEYEEKRSETYKFVKSKEQIEKEKSALKSKYEKEFDRLENSKLPENKKSKQLDNLIKEYDNKIEEIVIPEKYQEKERGKLSNQKKYENIYLGELQSRKIVEKNKTKIDSYWDEIKKINSQKISEPEKNKQKNDVKQKYYRNGLLGVINVESHENFLEKDAFAKELENATKSRVVANQFGGADSKEIDLNKYSKLVEKGKKLGLKLPSLDKLGYVPVITELKKVVEGVKNLNIDRMEPGILKYGKTKDEYDAEVSVNTPADEGATTETKMPDAKTNKTAEELKAETDKKANDARILAEQNKSFAGSPILDRFKDPGEFSDPQFEYTPGKQKIPFDALIGLTTGLMGVAAADSVEIKYRDEQIAEGMLQYAEDIAEIKNMGLDPAIEGSLKQKLADGYQTGLQNIVRASNGNRNLVLGNQGQLDQARMSGIVEIAAMDIDRTDKAMAAFGEVQKYISEFKANKSIANNERKYQEDQKKQMAGMQLASSGMANFIDSVQASKENAPGSINDMKRQWFQFQTTGLLPNAKDGEPGSLSHKTALQERNKLYETKKRTYSDWINSKNLDERELISKILEKNPQWDPTVNKAEGAEAAKFEDLEKEFNVLSGNEANRLAYLGKKEISVLDVKTQEQKVADGTAIHESEKMIEGTKPETQEEINAKKTAIAQAKTNGSNVPITRTTQPIATGTIVTKDNLADKTKQEQLNMSVLGYNVGPETINETKNDNALRVEEYNSLKEQNQ